MIVLFGRFELKNQCKTFRRVEVSRLFHADAGAGNTRVGIISSKFQRFAVRSIAPAEFILIIHGYFALIGRNIFELGKVSCIAVQFHNGSTLGICGADGKRQHCGGYGTIKLFHN